MKTVSTSNDEAAIRALENSFVAAFNAGDIDAIMKNYLFPTWRISLNDFFCR